MSILLFERLGRLPQLLFLDWTFPASAGAYWPDFHQVGDPKVIPQLLEGELKQLFEMKRRGDAAHSDDAAIALEFEFIRQDK
jgi:hypothetical protein